MKTQYEIALENLVKLRVNAYTGRGIVVGVDETGHNLIQATFMMSRSDPNRNRAYAVDGGRVLTVKADPAKPTGNPDLTIYTAMNETNPYVCRYFVISNGVQTDAVVKGKNTGLNLAQSLLDFEYEPDPPNYTPRITAISGIDSRFIAEMSIIRKSRSGVACDRMFYGYERIEPGFGFCMTEYIGDGKPLLSFQGEPLPVPLMGDIKAVAETLWETLNNKYRISLAVKFISRATGVSTVHTIDKYKIVAPLA